MSDCTYTFTGLNGKEQTITGKAQFKAFLVDGGLEFFGVQPSALVKNDPFAGNTLFTADKVAAARERMRKKLGTLNSGIDPELLVDGMTIAGAYIESGVRSFNAYAKAMVADMGDGVKPYLLSFWEGARNYPGLDSTGMTSPAESAAQHQSLLTPKVREASPEAIGQAVEKPANRTRKTGAKGDMTLTQDWGVEHINGYGDNTREIGNQTKDSFLAEARDYLRQVSQVLQDSGFAAHFDRNGKPMKLVNVNESGMAGSGEVSLAMRHVDGGANIYIHVGDSALRGMFPSTPSGIAVMARVSKVAGDTYASKGMNRWMPVDLSATDLAALILTEARGTMEAQSRTTDTKDTGNANPEQAGRAADQGGAPEVPGRGGLDNSPAARANSGDLETGQPQDVPAPADARGAGGDGVRVPAENVGGVRSAGEVGNANDGRQGDRGAQPPDAGAGGPGQRGRGKPAAGDSAINRRGPADAAPQRPVKAPEEVSPANPGPGNFHIDNPLEIVGGGQVARFDKNRAAIELLNQLREQGRMATAEEQRTLAGYTGWGSFGQELFQGTWAKPMPKPAWEARDAWLRDQLGKEEWESAQRSITNAHYTDPPTVMAMWDMVKRMGFGGGRVLEPSMGIGNFFGMMPADIKARSQLAGIELDELTGAMAKQLYPDANVKIMGYQESKTPDNFYDVVIGNWPFENTVIADRRYNTLSPFLHDYFFLKALDQVRPGGIVVGITSNGTMDKKATRIRAALAKKAELVTSIRLPSGAFQEYAGTKVVTDIVILKKRPEALSLVPEDGWTNSVAYKTPAGPEVFINEFYAKNPQNVIGTTDFGHGTTRMQPGMIVHRPDNMSERLRQAVDLVPQGILSRDNRTEHISYVTNHTADREGSLTVQAGKLFVVRGEHLAPANEVRKYELKSPAATGKREQELRALIDMRRKYAALIESERTGEATAARAALRDAYNAFEKSHGALAESWGLGYLKQIDDPFRTALAALTVNGKPSAILTESTIRGARAIEKPTPGDAYVLARNAAVNPTLGEIASIAKMPAAQVRDALVKSGAVFEAPNGDIVPSDVYMSGNVRQKLREASAALEDGNRAMERNIKALQEVVPKDIPYFNIESQLGATWVPAKTYAEYVAHMLNRPNADGIEVTFINGRWKVRVPDGANHSAEARTGFGTGFYPFSKLVNAAFTNQTVKIRRKDSDGSEFVDMEATDEANARIGDIRSKFGEWLWSDPERRVALEGEYNEVRNAYATPKYDGSFLSFEGMALSLGRGSFNLREHQVNAIWRALVNRRSINAHEVGTGKTFTMGGIAVESRRYGMAKKPLILAHNANSASVAHEIQMMYPAAKVLYVDNLAGDAITVKMRQIANDDWDAVVVPHSLIDRLSFREETLMAMAKEDIKSREEEAYAAAEEDGVVLESKMLEDEDELKKLRSITAKELVKARNRIIENVKNQAMRSSREGAIPFEELGIDMVLVDEVHEFKKPPISTRMNMKGLNTTTSNRSIALQFITRYIRSNNSGGNVHTFTGTPITNTMTEIFHQMRYVMEDEMKAAGVESWDGWFGSFAKEVQDVELSAAGEYETVTRLAGFINVPELRRMIGQYMDVVFAEDMPEMRPREVNGKTMTARDLTESERAELLNGRTEDAADRPYKKVVNVTSDLTSVQESIFRELQGYARQWRNMTGKQRMEAMRNGSPQSPIITEGLANKASFDARLIDDEQWAGQEGRAHDDAGSKASKVVANVLEVYRSHPQAGQVVFSDVGYSTSQKRANGRNAAGEKQYRTVKTFSTILDMVERLVQGGIPREQIAVVDGSTSKDKRKEIADAMNSSRIRVVIGSTDTLGVGVNMQRNLRAMHHMDAPYMPGELEQRNGRGLRQGNQWNTVMEYRYMTDRLDGRRWQILAIKQRFIQAFMKANSDSRVIEGDAASDEQSDILQSFSEAAGDPRILIREKLRKNVEALKRAERMHGNGVADARSALRSAAQSMEWNRGIVKQLTANSLPERIRSTLAEQSDNFTMTVRGAQYDSRKDAETAIDAFLKSDMRMEQSGIAVGQYRDIPVSAAWPSLVSQPELRIEIGGQEFISTSLRGLEQQMRNYPSRIEKVQAEIARKEVSIARMEEVANSPFARAGDLSAAVKRLDALERDIDMNPVPPPAWLRAGAPVDSAAFRDGVPFVVTGHRWTQDGWFVLAQDAKGDTAIPYTDVTDEQGMPLYDAREFQAPEVIEKPTKEPKPAQPGPVAFSRSGRAAMSPAWRKHVLQRTQATADAIRAHWSNGPEVVVAFDMQDPVVPEAVRLEDLRQRGGGAMGASEGFFFGGKVYLIASELHNVNDVTRVLFHEALGHYGLNGLFGKQLSPILSQIATMRRTEVDAKVKEYGLKGTEHDRRIAAEEVLCEMAQNTPELHFVRRAIAAIRTWLRANVPGMQSMRLTDEEIIRSYLLPARAFVERGSPGSRVHDRAGVGRDRPDQAQTENFKRWFGDWQNDANDDTQSPIRGADAGAGGGLQGDRDNAANSGRVADVNALQRPQDMGTDSAGGYAVGQAYFSGSSGPTGPDGAPLRLYHGTRDDITAFDINHPRRKDFGWLGDGVYLTDDPWEGGYYSQAKRGPNGPNVMPLYANVRNPYRATEIEKERLKTASKDAVRAFTARVKAMGHDGVVMERKAGFIELVAFAPAQVKSAIGNNGGFDAENPDIRFNRSKVQEIKGRALDQINAVMSHHGKISWWHKTIGTMYNLAERSPEFKRVFNSAQGFLDDVSHYATDAADMAPKLLPQLESMADAAKRPISAVDNKAIAAPIFEGTLVWSRDEAGKPVKVADLEKAAEGLTPDQKAQELLRRNAIDPGVLHAWKGMPLDNYAQAVASRYESQVLNAGIVWSDDELRSMFNLSDDQIALYREFRKATDRSMETMAVADMLRFGGALLSDVKSMALDASNMADAVSVMGQYLRELARSSPERVGELTAVMRGINERADKVADLKAKGYAPLSRFGKYTVDVVVNGEREYFGLFETVRESNAMAARMKELHGSGAVSQGTLSEEAFRLFQGITPESLELFGNMLGLDAEGSDASDKAFQEYLRLTKTNRSAMKRLIHRKGIAGFSEDVGRVLAGFIYSNARQTAAGLHMGELGAAVSDIPKAQGELKDLAVNLAEYVKNPRDEGQVMRGFLFAQYLGGSVASAMVNMLQPIQVTFPWLSQFTSVKSAAGQLGKAAKQMATPGHRWEAGLAEALKAAEDDGTVSPQEVHQLLRQAGGGGALRAGDGTKSGDLRANAFNAFEIVKFGWGSLFGAAEQVNRRMTFIAAYRIAKEKGMANPNEFARKAVIETQFQYSKANKMVWGRGAVGGTLMTFKTYSVAYVELLHRMWTQGGPEGRKAAGLALGMLMLMGGAGGLPFMEDAEDVATAVGQLMGYNLNAKQARMEVMQSIFGAAFTDFIDKGVSGLPGVPLDVSGRLGMGNLIPGTGLLTEKASHTRDVLEIVGPMGDFATRILTGAKHLAGGNVGGALMEVAPTAVRNAAKGIDMATTGMYRDQKGAKVIDTDMLEAAMKGIGFQPASVAKVQEGNAALQQSKNFYSLKAQEIRSMWATGIFEKDSTKVQEARGAIADWNRRNPDQTMRIDIPSVMRRVREMSKTKEQRILDSAPKGMRQQLREQAAQNG